MDTITTRLKDKILYKIGDFFGQYYTLDELVKRLDEETGMYDEFNSEGNMDNWSELPHRKGIDRESYYKALIRTLPIKVVGEGRINGYIKGRHQNFSIEDKKFSKRSVNAFIKKSKKMQECGEQTRYINFYTGVSKECLDRLRTNSTSPSYDIYEDCQEEDYSHEDILEDIIDPSINIAPLTDYEVINWLRGHDKHDDKEEQEEIEEKYRLHKIKQEEEEHQERTQKAEE